MEPPFIEKLFDFIGKVVFPRQQEWERRRNVQIMLSVVAVSLLMGIILWKMMKYMNKH